MGSSIWSKVQGTALRPLIHGAKKMTGQTVFGGARYVSVVVRTVLAGLMLCIAAPSFAFEIQETWVLRPDDSDDYDAFGWSVALSGRYMVAGAPGDDPAYRHSGSAYIFDVETGQAKHKLLPSQPILQGLFGASVAVEGSTALIGAPVIEALPGTDIFEEVYDPGSAYVFDVQTGQELYRLTPDVSAPLDHFGSRVAISGNIAVVTAWGDNHAGEDSGSAYVFDITTGQQLRKLTAVDARAGDHLGTAVAIDGDLVVIGATSDFSPGHNPGSAYVFDINTGEQLHKLSMPDVQYLDYYARSISASNGIALLGAHEYSLDDGAGYVDVFDITTGQFIRRLIGSDSKIGDGFGYATHLDGNLAIIGATGHVDESGRHGAIYFFDIRTGELVNKLTAPYFHMYDSFGFSLARDGDTTVVRATVYSGNNVSSGVVHVYQDIPEPAAALLIVVGMGALLQRDRKRLWPV